MKASEKLFALADGSGGVDEAKALAKEFAEAGFKQLAIDVYRCIIGNGRTLTRHLDHGAVRLLAETVVEQGNAPISS